MNSNIYAEIREIKKYAIDYNVPIMLDDGIDFLIGFLAKHQLQSVLEIGTAIGYSAIMMALSNPKVKVTSIERDRDRYLEAVKNVKKFHLEDRITLIFKDAFDVTLEDKFDLIFIDAAKSQSIRFFEKFERNLVEHGFVLTDNMSFHGLVAKGEQPELSRNVRGLVRKIKAYEEFLKNNSNYVTTFYEVGDGIAVSEKRF